MNLLCIFQKLYHPGTKIIFRFSVFRFITHKTIYRVIEVLIKGSEVIYSNYKNKHTKEQFDREPGRWHDLHITHASSGPGQQL